MLFSKIEKFRSAFKKVLLGGIVIFVVSCSEAQDVGDASQNTTKTDQVSPVSTGSVDIPQADGSVDMEDVLKPGPLEEMEMGNANATVTIVEYMSLTCPHCASFHKNTFNEIKTKYIDTGKVRFILREFPFDPIATAGIMLARCAPNGQFFSFVDIFLQQQRNITRAEDTRAELLKLAKLAGFTQETFNTCLTNQQLLDDVVEVRNRGTNDYGIQSTPSFIINGNRYSGDMSADKMSALINSLL